MIRLGKTTSVRPFNFFAGTGDSDHTGVCYMTYAKDLNGDGIDEVIFSGWETQPNTPAKYSNKFPFMVGEMEYSKILQHNFCPTELTELKLLVASASEISTVIVE
jgi:hypothetical protein